MSTDDSVKSTKPAKYWPRERGMSEATWNRMVVLTKANWLVRSVSEQLHPLSDKHMQPMPAIPASVAEAYRNRTQLPIRGFVDHEPTAEPCMSEADWTRDLDAREQRVINDIHALIDDLNELAKTVANSKLRASEP
jgi:hypothetical protein